MNKKRHVRKRAKQWHYLNWWEKHIITKSNGMKHSTYSHHFKRFRSNRLMAGKKAIELVLSGSHQVHIFSYERSFRTFGYIAVENGREDEKGRRLVGGDYYRPIYRHGSAQIQKVQRIKFNYQLYYREKDLEILRIKEKDYEKELKDYDSRISNGEILEEWEIPEKPKCIIPKKVEFSEFLNKDDVLDWVHEMGSTYEIH